MLHDASSFILVIVMLFVLRGHGLHVTIPQRDATDMGPPGSCLKLTTPDISLSYPVDAEAHFEDLHHALSPFLADRPHCGAGYCGPWIENYWVRNFTTKWEAEKQRAGESDSRLSNVFGPYIPILFTWADAWVNSGYRYPEGFVEVLKKNIRPNVPYITVSQNDAGLTGNFELIMAQIPNVLVLSAGGYGHVPVPLFKQREKKTHAPNFGSARKFVASFVGFAGHAPGRLREKMQQTMQDSLPPERIFVGKSAAWRAIMTNSFVSLTPRGYGRTSYHLVEAIQMGLVPVHIYSDIPWVPYAKLFERIGLKISLASLPALLHNISATATNTTWISKLSRMEREISLIREHYFMPEGIMDRIAEFIQGRVEESGLICQPLPESVRDAEENARDWDMGFRPWAYPAKLHDLYGDRISFERLNSSYGRQETGNS
jgi:hypothetical protein